MSNDHLIRQLEENARDGSGFAVIQLRKLEEQGVDIGERARRLIAPKKPQQEVAEKPKRPTAHEFKKESEFQSVVVTALRARGYMVTEGPKGSAGNGAVYYTAGTPDLTILKDGRVCWIELKQPTGRLSPEQQQWHEDCRAHGGLVFVAHDLYEVWDALEKAGML